MATIATWNVNSIGVRLEAICTWLQTSQPDVLMLQELKKQEADLPYDAISALGYEMTAVGQKAYNGVAIIVKRDFGALEVIHRALPGADRLSIEAKNGMQARYLEGQVAGLRLACLYLPNGNPARGGSLVDENGTQDEKFAYKLSWMDLLIDHARHVMTTEKPFILSGDYNIIPSDLDCWDPEAWRQDALTHPDSRRRFFELTSFGLSDAFRLVDHRGGQFSYWDYQKGRWQRGEGIRIDHHLISPEIADRLLSCRIDRGPREAEKASDHTPVVLNIKT